MSRGTKIIPLRIPPADLAEIDRQVRQSLDSARGEPWTRTSWILSAIRDKFAKQARSRRPKRRAEMNTAEVDEAIRRAAEANPLTSTEGVDFHCAP